VLKMRHLFLILFIFFNCFSSFSQSDTESKVIGDWYGSGETKFLFSSENIFQLHIGNKLFINGKYSFIDSDTIRVFVEDNFFMDYVYVYFNDSLVLYTYKSKSGQLRNHIDEITLLTRINKVSLNNSPSTYSQTDKFVLHDNYVGLVYVSFNQKVEHVQRFDSVGNRIIEIPSCGYIKTSFKEEPLKYALEKMSFIQNEKYIPFFIDSKILNLTDTELKQAGFDREKLYVCVLGFNQSSRKEINGIFGEDIQGNVLMFQVDTLKIILDDFKKY